MSTTSNTSNKIAVLITGFVSVVVVSAVIGYVHLKYNLALYSFMFALFIPIGAILCGVIAASGYFLGWKIFNQKPLGGIFLNILISSILAYLVIQFVPYYLMVTDGVRVREFISFGQYLNMDLQNTSLSVTSRRGHSSGEINLSTGWSYAYTVLQIIGFMIGEFVAFIKMMETPYCENCSTYYTIFKEEEQYSNDHEGFLNALKIFFNLTSSNKYKEAVIFHSSSVGVQKPGHHDNYLKSKLTICRCSDCNGFHVHLIASQKDEEGNWKKINGSEITGFTEEILNTL